jgi:hypothetical protein
MLEESQNKTEEEVLTRFVGHVDLETFEFVSFGGLHRF